MMHLQKVTYSQCYFLAAYYIHYSVLLKHYWYNILKYENISFHFNFSTLTVVVFLTFFFNSISF